MERKIKELPEVEDAVITFATKQLKVASNHQEDLLPVLQEICASIESEVVVKQKESKVHKEKQEENQKCDNRYSCRCSIVCSRDDI